jgi:GT2 family glycosyltransferase
MAVPVPAAVLRVAVVLVNWNGWRECVECIDSLLMQAHADFHVFVVDNDSTDHSVDQLIAWCAAPRPAPDWRRHPGVDRYTDHALDVPIGVRVIDGSEQVLPPAATGCRVTLIRSGANRGFAGGCNLGISAAGVAQFDFFWMLNPDTVVDRQALVELLARATMQPGTGIVGSTLLFYDKPSVVHALGGGRINRSNASSRHLGEGTLFKDVPPGAQVERELTFVCGASMLVSAEFIRDVGLMQDDYFLYYEEADWAMRGRERFRLGYAPQSIVFHKSGANSSKIMPLFTAGFYYRNRLRFVGRFLPDRMKAAKRTLFVEMLRHVARGRWGLARVVMQTLIEPPEVEALVRH